MTHVFVFHIIFLYLYFNFNFNFRYFFKKKIFTDQAQHSSLGGSWGFDQHAGAAQRMNVAIVCVVASVIFTFVYGYGENVALQ
jgi:hypothetical protein